MRQMFWSHVLDNPVLALELYIYWKPRHIIRVLSLALRGIDNWNWLIVVLSSAAVAFGVTSVSKGSPWGTEDILIASLIVPFCAVLPHMWAFASMHTIADSVLSLLIAIVFFSCWLLTSLIVIWAGRGLALAACSTARPLPGEPRLSEGHTAAP